LLLRAGSVDIADEQQDFENRQKSVSVIVTTSFGSSFLDKKKKFILPSNSTVSDLKNQIAAKFPGSPPKHIQRLFFSSRLLNNDSEIISNVSIMQPVPIILDSISGTGVYNRSLSVSQGIEAYVSTLVQQSYLGNKLNSLFQQSVDPVNLNSNSTSQSMESIIYRNMFVTLNESFYATYSDEIEAALQAERNPEVLAADTIAWRHADRKKISPLAAALAKEFDLNLRGLVSFVYYSVVLLVRTIMIYLYVISSLFRLNLFYSSFIYSLSGVRMLWYEYCYFLTSSFIDGSSSMDIQAKTTASPRQGQILYNSLNMYRMQHILMNWNRLPCTWCCLQWAK